MKKKLFYLFALICSISLFTACSDDDDNSWKELPSGEIIAEKVELRLNGESTTGTIDFKASSLEAAQLNLKNVIDGYSDIPVAVKMEKQTDGSFKLSGTYETSAKPVTKMANTPTPMLRVTVDGTIYLDGKLTANIATSGAGLYIGTYSGKTLALSYGEAALVGKTVVLDATTGDNVSILLKDVIPGEKETTIANIKLMDGKFSGTAKTTYAAVEYSGSHANKVLTLNLKVTMDNPGKWVGNYGLTDYKIAEFNYGGMALSMPGSGAMYSNWVAEEDYVVILSGMFRTIGGLLLPQVLNTISLEADGNITAQYLDKPAISFEQDWIVGIMFTGQAPGEDVAKSLIPQNGWQSSPKNLAFWYEKDNKLYVKLNIPSILSQSAGVDAGGLGEIIDLILQSDPATIKKLVQQLGFDLSTVSDATISQLLDWVNNGIPMVVTKKDGHTYMSLDKSSFDSLFTLRDTGKVDEDWGEPIMTSDMLEMWSTLSKAGIIPEEMQAASLIVNMIGSYWGGTSEFNLGLDLQAK